MNKYGRTARGCINLFGEVNINFLIQSELGKTSVAEKVRFDENSDVKDIKRFLNISFIRVVKFKNDKDALSDGTHVQIVETDKRSAIVCYDKSERYECFTINLDDNLSFYSVYEKSKGYVTESPARFDQINKAKRLSSEFNELFSREINRFEILECHGVYLQNYLENLKRRG